MPVSWNEIRDRALAFSKEYADESSEDAEAKSFWDGFSMSFASPDAAAIGQTIRVLSHRLSIVGVNLLQNLLTSQEPVSLRYAHELLSKQSKTI